MPPSREYIVVPPRFIDDPALLEEWVARSIDYVTTIPLKQKKQKAKRTER
jgi:hypothetical protein